MDNLAPELCNPDSHPENSVPISYPSASFHGLDTVFIFVQLLITVYLLGIYPEHLSSAFQWSSCFLSSLDFISRSWSPEEKVLLSNTTICIRMGPGP